MKASDGQRGPHAVKGSDKPHARKQDRRELRSPTLFLTSLSFHPLGQTEPGSAFLPLLSVCALVRTKSLLPDSEVGELCFVLKEAAKATPAAHGSGWSKVIGQGRTPHLRSA